MRRITILFTLLTTFLAVSPQSCGKSGVCTPVQDCLPFLNDLKQNKLENEQYCDDDEEIVCCEQPNLTRISERKCLEYMDYVFEKRYVPAEDPEDDPELTKVCTCTQNSVPFILGGDETDRHEFPHMALIGDNTSSHDIQWFCGGSLISPRFVLTAAHCLHGFRKGKRVEARIVRLGIHHVSNPEEHRIDVGVKRQISHFLYKSNQIYNDIALLELFQEVQSHPKLRPACLPSPRERNLPQRLIAAGWGVTESKVQSDVLLKVDLPLVENCQNILGRKLRRGIQDTQICYGGEVGKDACQGDSGGPLQGNSYHVYCSYTIYGVTSIGRECGEEQGPSVYTKVERYLDWIERIVWPNESI